ncbi:TetR/AcrR family transcriptional regulator [Yinghuangia seranimata]|uniref:TetR/AcrR family transcriptional regulator n=1 Tax=Yinghuangia seranimata TaxID=408067 RepID=UPI00248BE526|nr:TetR/AcrR family transcriptional regulator [Yinghuangia seranimata]MDI2126910.1 TetR/AcrR family transcriptional regulator [Yinghuangia seranimata]
MTATKNAPHNAGTVRMSADERRTAAVRAAVEEFSVGGYNGTSTAAIAKRIGVSQPYLFRLFDDKRQLFLAAVEECFRRVVVTFDQATEGLDGIAATHAMGHAYQELLDREPTLLRMQMQAYVAGMDPDLQADIRACWSKLDELVRVRTGITGEELTNFFARGMLCNVIAALDLPKQIYFEETYDEQGDVVHCDYCREAEAAAAAKAADAG